MKKDASYLLSIDSSHVIRNIRKPSVELCSYECAVNAKDSGCKKFTYKIGSGKNCWLFNSDDVDVTYELGAYSGTSRARGNLQFTDFRLHLDIEVIDQLQPFNLLRHF